MRSFPFSHVSFKIFAFFLLLKEAKGFYVTQPWWDYGRKLFDILFAHAMDTQTTAVALGIFHIHDGPALPSAA